MSAPARSEFDSKVVLVTGAASGIGRSTALRFAEHGACVVVADINGGGARAAAEQIVAAGGNAHDVALDIAMASDVNQCIEDILERFGRLDVLVNNAAVIDSMDPIHETDDAEWARVIGVNLTGTFHVARRAVPPLLQSNGSIVNVASVAGLHGARGGASYTASKHGIIGLTKSIAWMYADRGLRCNVVCPGPVETNIRASTEHFSEMGMARLSPVLAGHVRRAEAGEIAGVITFLASAAASYVNGAVVTADGGWTAA